MAATKQECGKVKSPKTKRAERSGEKLTINLQITALLLSGGVNEMPLVWRGSTGLRTCRVKIHERARRNNLIVVGHLSVLTTGEFLSAAADMTRPQKRKRR